MSRFQWHFSNSLLKSDSAKTECSLDVRSSQTKGLDIKPPNLTGQILFMECQLLVHPLMLLLSLYWFSIRSWGALMSQRNPSEGRTSPWGVRLCSRDLCFFCCVTREFCEAAELNETFWEGSEQKTIHQWECSWLSSLLILCISGRVLLFISFLLISFQANLHVFDLFSLYFRALSNSL